MEVKIWGVGCNICIDKPTRIVQFNNSTCIDHVYSNFSCHRLDTKIITSDVSDHFSTLTKISGIPKNTDDDEVFYYRRSNLNEDEWKNFNLEIKAKGWKTVKTKKLNPVSPNRDKF